MEELQLQAAMQLSAGPVASSSTTQKQKKASWVDRSGPKCLNKQQLELKA
jgi:hypothetical protein